MHLLSVMVALVHVKSTEWTYAICICIFVMNSHEEFVHCLPAAGSIVLLSVTVSHEVGDW